MRTGLPALFCTPCLGPLEFSWITAEHDRALKALASAEPKYSAVSAYKVPASAWCDFGAAEAAFMDLWHHVSPNGSSLPHALSRVEAACHQSLQDL